MHVATITTQTQRVMMVQSPEVSHPTEEFPEHSPSNAELE